MKNLLLPIDGSERSLRSVELVKEIYKPSEVYINILMVREDVIGPLPEQSLEPNQGLAREKMQEVAGLLDGYNINPEIIFGRAGEEIVRYAKREDIDIIIMTKSTKKGWIQTIGSVTAYVVKYAPCMVLIAPEEQGAIK